MGQVIQVMSCDLEQTEASVERYIHDSATTAHQLPFWENGALDKAVSQPICSFLFGPQNKC